MHTTVAQNKAHKADTEWSKTPGKAFKVQVGNLVLAFVSEYTHAESGWAIRKTWEYVAMPWVVFNAEGEIVAKANSLTWAKEYFTRLYQQEA